MKNNTLWSGKTHSNPVLASTQRNLPMMQSPKKVPRTQTLENYKGPVLSCISAQNEWLSHAKENSRKNSLSRESSGKLSKKNKPFFSTCDTNIASFACFSSPNVFSISFCPPPHVGYFILFRSSASSRSRRPSSSWPSSKQRHEQQWQQHANPTFSSFYFFKWWL